MVDSALGALSAPVGRLAVVDGALDTLSLLGWLAVVDSALDTVSALLGRLAVVDGPLGTLSALPGWMVVVDGPLGTLSAPVGWLAAVDGPLGALLAREAGDPPRSSKSLRESPQAGRCLSGPPFMQQSLCALGGADQVTTEPSGP